MAWIADEEWGKGLTLYERHLLSNFCATDDEVKNPYFIRVEVYERLLTEVLCTD